MRNLLDVKNEADVTAGDDAKKAGGEGDEGEGGIILGKKGKGAKAALPTKTEMHALRTAIQTLCQSSNPLGRCLEFAQEDLEAMAKEREQWRAVRRRRSAELGEEESTTENSLVQLQQELSGLDAQAPPPPPPPPPPPLLHLHLPLPLHHLRRLPLRVHASVTPPPAAEREEGADQFLQGFDHPQRRKGTAKYSTANPHPCPCHTYS